MGGRIHRQMPRPLSARLNRVAELWGNSQFTNELGETDFAPMKIRDLHVAIIPQTGAMIRGQAETLLSNVTTKFICRYRTDITVDMWLMYAGKRHNIKYILDPYAAHETLEIFCEEVV